MTVYNLLFHPCLFSGKFLELNFFGYFFACSQNIWLAKTMFVQLALSVLKIFAKTYLWILSDIYMCLGAASTLTSGW